MTDQPPGSARRLPRRLVQLPECALTRPADKACTTVTPLKSVNNAVKQTLTVQAPVGAVAPALDQSAVG